VAIGAACAGGVLAGEVRGRAVADVTPAIAGHRGRWVGFSPADSSATRGADAQERKYFRRQRQPDVGGDQGRTRASGRFSKDNRLLGVFQLVGIPSGPRGIPQIEVTFDIDANGILHVSAKDRARVTAEDYDHVFIGLSKDEVEKLARDADAHKAEGRAPQRGD